MSKLGEFTGALAANFIVAGVMLKLQGAEAAVISCGIGLLFLFVYFVFFRKKAETVPAIRVENNPNISPTFSPTFNPTIHIGVPATAATAPTAPSDSRPKLTLDRWETQAETLDMWESGFVVSNHGETALDVQVQRFQITEGKFASSSPVASIAACERDVFVPVWVEGFAPPDMQKWDLLNAMKAASDARPDIPHGRDNYVLRIIVRFKDFDDNVYESAADLHYVPSRRELVFRATRQRKIEAYTEVLAFLERTMQPNRGVTYFVEHIASATNFSEGQVADALQRLHSEGHVFRSNIEGYGTNGDHTKWGFVYWYAHF
jgi:hypothetical protein